MNKRMKTIALTLTEKCNLNCIYCYEHNKDCAVMTFDTATNAISRHFVDDDDYDEVEINFHGGEPFLSFDLMKEICEWVWERYWPKPYHIFATTNGTVIDDAMKEWLTNNKHRFFLGLSIDGTKKMHDINRNSSYDLIDKEFFIKNWPNQGVKMTVSPQSVPYLAEGVKELHKLGFVVNANPALGVDWNSDKELETYAAQLKILADFYIDNPDIRPCSLFKMNLSIINEGVKKLKPKWCGTGEHMVAVSPEGHEYPCHAFMPSLNSERDNSKSAWELISSSDFQDEKCEKCVIKQQCATCYGMNYFERGAIEKRDTGYCKLNKIRAVANSYMFGKMLLQPEKYPYLDKEKISEIALGVITIQKAFGVDSVLI